ncbi:MAG TPA: hypothetical protein PLQ35_14480 [bacterium]|nr:hypothetical protein [bacterium]
MKHNPVAICYEDLENRLIRDDGPAVDEPENKAQAFYVVLWPEHVLTPRYNGDCDIHGPMTREDAAVYRDGVRFYHGY